LRSLGHLLRRVSLPYARRHLGLTLLTITGVALGVAVFLAIQLASVSLGDALRGTIDRVAGKAQLQVTSGEVGLPEEALDTVRAVAGVRAAAPAIEAIVQSEKASEGNLLILGVDLTGDRELRDYEFKEDDDAIEDPLVFLAQPDSLCLSADFAARNGLEEEDEIEFETALGPKAFTVRGLLQPKGFVTAFGGNLAVMDVYAAQYVFNRGRRFDRIDVLLEPGVKVADATTAIAAALGPGYVVEPPFRRGAELESLMDAFSASMDLSCWQALFVGIFLIFNVFSVAVTRRREEIGTLRALGAGPARIRQMFLAEGAVLGLAGSLLGVAAGLLLARGTTAFMRELVASAYGLAQVSAEVTWSWPIITVAASLGVAASILAAWYPARAAARLDPVEALSKAGSMRFHPASVAGRRIAGLATILAVTAVHLHARAHPQFLWALATLGITGVAVILLAPDVTGLASRALRPILARAGGVEGRLAADSLIAAPRRTSATMAALMLSVAFGISQAGYATSFEKSFSRWLEQSLSADFYVTGTERFLSKAFQFPASYAEEMAAIEGVRHVERIRVIHQRYRGELITLLAMDAEKFLSRADIWVVEGDPSRAKADLAAGRGVTISDNLAARRGLHAGESIELDTPTGPVSFPIAGVIVEYSSDKGTIYMDRTLFVERWRDDTVDTFDIMLNPGADPARVKASILETFSLRGTRLFVFTGGEFRARISKVTDQFFGVVYVQFGISLLVAVLGIVNSLLISVTERRREIGIFKAVGGLRPQVRWLILIEALAIGSAGTLLGFLLGAYLIDVAVSLLGASMSGWVLPYTYPVAAAAGALPLLLAVALAAAWYPARVALSTPAVEALAYE